MTISCHAIPDADGELRHYGFWDDSRNCLIDVVVNPDEATNIPGRLEQLLSNVDHTLSEPELEEVLTEMVSDYLDRDLCFDCGFYVPRIECDSGDDGKTICNSCAGIGWET